MALRVGNGIYLALCAYYNCTHVHMYTLCQANHGNILLVTLCCA